MNNEDKARVNYRFSGYQLNLIQLDATGAAYAIEWPHPYYRNQPESWAQPYYPGQPGDLSNTSQTTGWHGTLYPFSSTNPET